MKRQPTVLGIITARGGSRSIPRKNMALLLGKPLIVYTIEAARASERLTRCIVSTDDEEIARTARDYGVEVPFMRPLALATDTATSIDVVKHALDTLEMDDGSNYDYVLILQPTSPLRIAADIDAAIQIAIEHDADSVMGMRELDDFSIEKLKVITDEGYIRPLSIEEGKMSSRRQDLQKIYKRNAAIYLTKTSVIREGDLFGVRSCAYIMPEERSLDINRPIDLEFASLLLAKRTH